MSQSTSTVRRKPQAQRYGVALNKTHILSAVSLFFSLAFRKKKKKISEKFEGKKIFSSLVKVKSFHHRHQRDIFWSPHNDMITRLFLRPRQKIIAAA